MNAPIITLMTKDEAEQKVLEINELSDEEMYDTLEEVWVTVLKASSIQGRMNPDSYYLCVELRPLNEDSIMYVPYDYFRKYVKINKPTSN